jgi:hypothetical protein
MLSYATLRLAASKADLSPLQNPLPPPDTSPIDATRVHLMGCALLRFNCNYGDLIRWLGGPYTDAHRNWVDVFAELETVRDCPPPDSFPSPDYERTLRACTDGIPLQACYISDYASAELRNSAHMSSDLQQNEADVDETLRKEEKLSYHIIFPRFLWRFFPGIFISIFRVAYRYGDPKPRLCVDPSTTIFSPDDTGNVNRNIPDPGIDEDANPTIYYGTAFLRYLIWLWNLRITYPTDDILQMTDDISAAFHRVLYHPDIGPAFATVWKSHLIIPASAIFGSKSSPGNYMWKGKLRAHFSNFATLPDSAHQEPLIRRLILPPPLTREEITAISPAVADPLNPGISIRQDGTPERRHPSFVDDTGVAHIRSHFITSTRCLVTPTKTLPDRHASTPQNGTTQCVTNYSSWDTTLIHAKCWSAGRWQSEEN